MASFSNTEVVKRINLDNEKHKVSSDDKELVVILLSGTIEIGSKTVSRKNVFDDEPVGFYVANCGLFTIKAVGKAELCLIESPSKNYIVALDSLSSANVKKRVDLQMISTEETTIKKVGTGNYYREVNTIVDSKSGLENLIVGETKKTNGNWSSWPPHKHDHFTENKESKQKEIYLYKFRDDNGFGIQLVYEDEVSNPIIVKNNDEVKIEKGYHPVVCSPHSEMYYLWVLFGDNSFFKVRYEEK